MGSTNIVKAGEAGLASIVEEVSKVRGALPEDLREAADRKLGVETPLGQGVKAVVDAVVEESAKARAAASAAVAEVGAVRAMDAAELEEKMRALGEAAGKKSEEVRGSAGKILVGTVALGAAAGSAFFVWRRRRATVEEQLSGEAQWGVTPTVADEQSPEAQDPHSAEEIDEVADELAREFVDSIDVDSDDAPADAATDVADAPEPEAAIVDVVGSNEDVKPEE